MCIAHSHDFLKLKFVLFLAEIGMTMSKIAFFFGEGGCFARGLEI